MRESDPFENEFRLLANFAVELKQEYGPYDGAARLFREMLEKRNGHFDAMPVARAIYEMAEPHLEATALMAPEAAERQMGWLRDVFVNLAHYVRHHATEEAKPPHFCDSMICSLASIVHTWPQN